MDALKACSGIRLCCVCSRKDASRFHRVQPFRTADDPSLAFGRLKALAAGMPRTRVVKETDDYFHAQSLGRDLCCVDHREVRLWQSEGLIQVRSSASGFCLYDRGVKRRSVECLRRKQHAGSAEGEP